MLNSEFKIIDGIKCYSPGLAISNDGFKREGFELLYKAEEKNFWFRSRNNVIIDLFKKYLGTSDEKKILEIGCGTGFVLKGLSDFKSYILTGAEIHIEGLKYAKKRLADVEFIQCDATDLPFRNVYDAIGAFDVLEHIEEDEKVMKSVSDALKPGGKFFITVPQHMFMWSAEDEISCHKRRYSRNELNEKIIKSGFEVNYVSSFVTALFPAMYLSRLSQRITKKSPSSDINSNNELQLNPVVNSAFESIMKVDEAFIRSGLSLPFGGSLVMVASKKTN